MAVFQIKIAIYNVYNNTIIHSFSGNKSDSHFSNGDHFSVFIVPVISFFRNYFYNSSSVIRNSGGILNALEFKKNINK